jgi:hypothetical protein
MKQTAVQWCVDKIDLLTHSYFLGAVKGTEYYEKLTDIVKEAMELEKKQIINADLAGVKRTVTNVHTNFVKIPEVLKNIEKIEAGILNHENGQQYYNKTYGRESN